MRCWCGYLPGVWCRSFAYSLADATAISKPHHLLSHLNPDWFYLFGTALLTTQVVLEKSLLNGCGVVVVVVYRYGDSVDNTVEENSSVFSLI